MFFCDFANYSAHLLLPQADEPRICYCLREQDSNRPRIALLFLIPISHLIALLEFYLPLSEFNHRCPWAMSNVRCTRGGTISSWVTRRTGKACTGHPSNAARYLL